MDAGSTVLLRCSRSFLAQLGLSAMSAVAPRNGEYALSRGNSRLCCGAEIADTRSRFGMGTMVLPSTCVMLLRLASVLMVALATCAAAQDAGPAAAPSLLPKPG